MFYYSQYNKKNIKKKQKCHLQRHTLPKRDTLTFQKCNRELISVQVIDVFPQIGIENPGYKTFQHDYILKTRCLKIMDHSLFLSLMVIEESMKETKKEINRKKQIIFWADFLLCLPWGWTNAKPRFKKKRGDEHCKMPCWQRIKPRNSHKFTKKHLELQVVYLFHATDH